MQSQAQASSALEVPHLIVPQRKLSTDYLLQLSKLDSQIGISKRKVSQMSTASTSSAKGFGDDLMDEKSKGIGYVLQRINVEEAAYRDAFTKGAINRETFNSAHAQCRRKRIKFATEDIIIRRNRDGFLEEFQILEERGQEASVEEYQKAYEVLLTTHMLRTAEGHGRDTKVNGRILQAMREYYNVVSPETRTEKPGHQDLWCCVTRRYKLNEKKVSTKMAYIIPHDMGNRNVAFLLGLDPNQDVLQDPKNLMFLDSGIEDKFDRGQLTIVPIPTEPGSPQRYKIILTDLSIADKTAGRNLVKEGHNTWSDVDGRELEFKNDRRPGRRNLYLHAVISYLRAQEHLFPRYDTLKEKLFTGSAWATPGAIARKSMLQHLASRVGDLPAEVTVATFDHTDPRKEPRPEEEELAKRSLSLALDRRCGEDDEQEWETEEGEEEEEEEEE